ncbi:hypothetical protein JXA05_01125 [Candidatus Peregrinibacteria bacterium]|nr:hypothetical protein [Candidatus Peregrinibacteria bacterium]
MPSKIFHNKGAVALVATVILAAVILTVSLGAVFMGISSRLNAYHLLVSERVFVKTEGCAEEALIRLHRDSEYAGETYEIDGVSCAAEISGMGETRTIKVTGSEQHFQHDIEMAVHLDPAFGILSWSE